MDSIKAQFIFGLFIEHKQTKISSCEVQVQKLMRYDKNWGHFSHSMYTRVSLLFLFVLEHFSHRKVA